LARVGNDNVTRRDLAAEIAASGDYGDAEAAMRGPALSKVIERRLLVQEARRRGLDRSPDYLAGMRRQRETLLVELLERQVQAQTRPPRSTDIAAFIRSHPWMFASRQTMVVDRITFYDAAIDAASLAKLPSLNEVAASLTGMQQGYRQDRARIDTATLSPADAERLAVAEIGGVLPFASTGGTALVTVRERSAAPVTGPAASRLADLLLRRETAAETIDDIISDQQKTTGIKYQTGYGPASK
jgi:peptidyl-prolyl cis-trans isomerase C